MLISCPECTTKFSIADAVLGERGRKVRCFKCGHTWHQNPPGAEPSPAVQPAPPVEPPAPRPPTQPLMPPTPTVGMETQEAELSAKAPAPPPTPAPAPIPQPTAEPVPLESAPMDGGFVPPAPPSNSSSIPLDSDPSAGEKSSIDPLDIPNLDDLDAAAVAPSSSADLTESNNTVDMDALLDSTAEDIPKVLASRLRQQEKKKASLGSKLFVLVLILAMIGAGLWFARKEITHRFPITAQYYKMAGISVEVLDEGLEFRGVTPDMTKRNGTQVLIVRGVIVNTLPRERSVPLLRLVLLDSNGAMIQEAFAKPRRDKLEAGAQIGFQVMMENPSAAAARYEVAFAEPPAESAQPEEIKTPPQPEPQTP